MSDKNKPEDATVTSATDVSLALKMVAYTDGGCRPTSRGTGGWGVHGYIYLDVPAKQGAGSKGLPTATGYDMTASGKPEITIVEYVDAFGAIPDSTNNMSEVMAVVRAYEFALSKGVAELMIRSDSKYALDGRAKWMHSWAANKWQHRQGGDIPNRKAWELLYALDAEAKQKGLVVKTLHVDGHSGETGNDRADMAATCGVISGFNNSLDEVVQWSDAKGYWSKSRSVNRLITHPFWYFTSQADALRTSSDGRHIVVCGKIDRKEMEVIGKPIADTAMSILFLKERDPSMDAVEAAAARMAAGAYQGLVVGDLTNVRKPLVSDMLREHGERLILIDPVRRRLHMGHDSSMVAEEIHPPRLSLVWGEEATTAINILESFLAGKSPDLVATDITDVLYAPAVSEKDTPKLKDTIRPGIRTHKLKAKYAKADGSLGEIDLVLNNDQDIPDRNALAAAAGTDTRVHILTWRSSGAAIRYATVIQTGGDAGLWVGPYSNLKLVL